MRQDDVTHFIHGVSPNTTLGKDEALDDENTSSQPNKVDRNNDRNNNLPTKIIHRSFIHLVGHSASPSPSQLQNHYEVGYDMISKQCYSGQGLGKMEQGIKVPAELLSQCTREGLGFPLPSLSTLIPKPNLTLEGRHYIFYVLLSLASAKPF